MPTPRAPRPPPRPAPAQTVSGLSAVRTRHGMTTPHLLLSTAAGGVLMVDRRLVDPRRPQGAPTDAERAEGLAQYSPALPLLHTWLLTHAHAVPRLRDVSSAPADFESTALVSALGLDTFVARTAPAKAFDMLDDKFNVLFFGAVIAACAVGGLLLRHLVIDADVSAAWK